MGGYGLDFVLCFEFSCLASSTRSIAFPSPLQLPAITDGGSGNCACFGVRLARHRDVLPGPRFHTRGVCGRVYLFLSGRSCS
jgi:hypothetical protein